MAYADLTRPTPPMLRILIYDQDPAANGILRAQIRDYITVSKKASSMEAGV